MNKFFKIEERGSTVMTEILAGLTIFITMAYVLAVQPSAIMGFGGDATFVDISGLVISRSALLVSCALVTGVICMFMGLYANIPVAISTAMGTNFILGSLVQSGKVSFGWIMAALLVSGLLFVIMSVTGVRKFIVEMIPGNLKIAMTVSVGFFIAMLGFQNTGLATYEGGLGLGDFKSPGVLLTLIAILLIGILHAYKVKGAILIGVLAATVIGIPMGVTKVPASLVALPSVSEYGNLVFAYDFKALLSNIPEALVWIFILFVGDFFGTLSCVTAIGVQTGMADEHGNFPDMQKPFIVDSIGTVVGSATGNTTVSTFIESTAGVAAGGRTGLSIVVVAIMFFISIFFAPLFIMIPNAATGAALIFVGFSMLSSFSKLDLSDFAGYFGPFLMILIVVFTGQMAGAIAFGILADVFMKVVTGKFRQVPIPMYILCIPLVLYFLV